MLVEVYLKAACQLCDDALDVISSARATWQFELIERNIADDANWYSMYRYRIPAIVINGELCFEHRVDRRAFVDALRRKRGVVE